MGKIWKRKDSKGKILEIMTLLSCIRLENFIYIAGDILTRLGRTAIYVESLNDCGAKWVTGFLHGLNEGHLSLGPKIIYIPSPCWEVIECRNWEYGGRYRTENWGWCWHQSWTCAERWNGTLSQTVCCICCVWFTVMMSYVRDPEMSEESYWHDGEGLNSV